MNEHPLFSDFPLAAPLIKELASRGFDEPTPVQRGVLGQDDWDRDLVVQARTGSGKTLAFLLPVLSELASRLFPGRQTVKALILSPTRELAQQIAQEAASFGRLVGIGTAVLVGGMDMDRQISSLRSGVALAVGTPGRVLDHVKRGTLDLSEIETVVLDEGDTMLDMGFRDEMEAILQAASARKRTWLFSATIPQEVTAVCRRFTTNPVFLSFDDESSQHSDIVHKAYLVPSSQRYEGLVNVLLWERPSLCLIFCRTRSDTADVTERLQKEGFLAMPLHGDMSQRERNTALSSFRSGRIPVLVATNVAARGLDVSGVSHVIQLGVPESLETFVHRSGRTGRAGHEGTNLLVLTPAESSRFKFMMRSAQMKVQWLKVPDFQEISVVQRSVRQEKLLAVEPSEELFSWAHELLETAGEDPTALVAKLLASVTQDEPKGYRLRDSLLQELERRSARREARETPSGRAGFRRPSEEQKKDRYPGSGVSIRIAKGRRDDDWSVGRILGALCGALGVDRTEIGNIKMRETYTEVQLGPKALSQLNSGGRLRLADKGLLSGEGGQNFVPRLGSAPRRRRFDPSGRKIDDGFTKASQKK